MFSKENGFVVRMVIHEETTICIRDKNAKKSIDKTIRISLGNLLLMCEGGNLIVKDNNTPAIVITGSIETTFDGVSLKNTTPEWGIFTNIPKTEKEKIEIVNQVGFVVTTRTKLFGSNYTEVMFINDWLKQDKAFFEKYKLFFER